MCISQILHPLLRGKALHTEQTRCRDSNMLVGTDSTRHDQKPHHVPTAKENSCQYQLHQAVMAQPHCIRVSIIYCLQTLLEKESQDTSLREMDFVKLLQGSSYSAGGYDSTCSKMPARSSSGPSTRTWLKARIRL